MSELSTRTDDENGADGDVIAAAVDLLVHRGEPNAGVHLRDEHSRDERGRCRGCTHAGSLAPLFPCVLRVIGEGVVRREGRLSVVRVPTVASDDARRRAGDPSTRRYPCAWCAIPDRWPDACSERADAADAQCATTIEQQCMRGDHRRCDPSACVVAARWHEPVRKAGTEAARSAGAAWAVVSTIPNAVTVIGTENNLGRAKLRLRTVMAGAGRPVDDAEGRGLVYIVRSSDGALL